MTNPQRVVLECSFNNPNSPSRYKMSLLTWAAAFPVMTTLDVLFGPQLALLPLPARTLLLTGTLIGLLTFVVMPGLTRLCDRWLNPPGVAAEASLPITHA